MTYICFDLMVTNKGFTDFTNLFSPNKYLSAAEMFIHIHLDFIFEVHKYKNVPPFLQVKKSRSNINVLDEYTLKIFLSKKSQFIIKKNMILSVKRIRNSKTLKGHSQFGYNF